MAYKNFYSKESSFFAFSKSTFSSYFSSNGWTGIPASSSSITVTSTSSSITLGTTKYTLYQITTGVMELKTGAIRFFKTGDGVKGAPTSGIDYNVTIKSPTSLTGSSVKSAPAKFEMVGYIKLTKNNLQYYYQVWEEVTQSVVIMNWDNIISPQQTSFKPYEQITQEKIGGVTARATPSERTFDSSSIGNATTGESKTFSYEELMGFPSAGYYTEPKTSNNLYFRYAYNNQNYNYYFSLSTTDWDTKIYKIQENATDYNVYVGKTVGDDFLQHFSLVYSCSNEYKSITTIVQSSLDIDGLSKTKFSYTDTYVNFNYSYEENTIAFSSSKKVIQLADGNAKYNAIIIKNSYLQGEYFDSSLIDIKNSGYLIYEDGATISLSDVDWHDQPRITSTIDDPIMLDESILGFDLTYIMATSYFGYLTYTFHVEVSGQTEDYITRVELSNKDVNFVAGNIISFPKNSKLLCYNHNDELIKTIDYDDFGKYITTYPEYYGKVVPKLFLTDEKIALPFKFQTYRDVEWNAFISYYEDTLSIDISNAKRNYYIGGKYGEEIILDKSNIIATAIYHSNTSEKIGIINEYDVSNKIGLHTNTIDVLSGTKIYSVIVSYIDDINSTDQGMNNKYEISVTRYEAKKIEIIGNGDSLHYWDNDLDVFHYPNGLVFNRIYSDGSVETITDLSSLQFYRDEELTNRLIIGESIIKKNDGYRLFVYDPITDISGSFLIEFDIDTITNVNLISNVNFVLGNKFNSIRNDLQIKAIYSSGNINTIDNYTFKNNDFILEETDLVIIIDENEYLLDKEKITFIKPSISSISLNTSKFPLTYNNVSDSIDASSLVATVRYENAAYVETCNFKNGQIIENDNEFLVTSTELPTYVFDGSETLNVSMGEYFEKRISLTIKVRNRFNHDNIENSSIDLTVSVIEITEITGISLIKIYTDYYVNETFLNDNDTTEVQIFYKDSSGIQKKLSVKLNSDFSALNIFPLKGTKFTNVTNSRTIKITSATNYNVCCEYTISVNAKYNYSSTKNHDIVAIYQGAYQTPNGETITDKYLLISRMDDEGHNNTKITSDGERVLVENKIIDDVKVFGYLDDIFDESKNARVILFDDYIAPVEGTNNITVKFPCYIEGNSDIINKCKFGILFGNNNAKNRLFLSGNSDIPNCDWHSGQIDSNYLEDESMINGNFGYFEDTSYCYYGETDNAIVGYDIVSNDKLLVLKNKSDKETTIYFRTPTLLQAIDASGTSMTGVDGETLYQEEFPLTKGNNSVAAISQKGIVNFNGDSLFLSDDKNLVGLDLTGIIGDNQRYANSRSRYIDEDLKKYDMSKSWLWSNNKDLYIILNDKIFISHYETKSDNQYEWWVMNIKDIQSILELDNIKYLANSQGQLYRVTNNYDDIDKLFIGQGGSLLITEGVDNDEIIVSQQIIDQINDNEKSLFKIIPSENKDASYMYYQIAIISNVKNGTFDFYVNRSNNCLELLCYVSGNTDYEKVNQITNLISESKCIYLNHIDGENEIAAFPNSSIKTYYKKYYLKRYYSDNDALLNDCYKLIDAITNEEVDISVLYRASICYKLEEEYELTNINKENCSFNLKLDNQIINLVRYADQDISRSFKAEIKRYHPVEAYYITKPFTMGSLDYFKTVWSWTLTNDTSIPSELEIAIANNKIPFDSMRTLASISKDKFSFNLNDLDFRKVDLQKNIVPRTYTNQRIISQLKFICFGFRNFNNTNSVLSSMSIIYTVPFPSYGGD